MIVYLAQVLLFWQLALFIVFKIKKSSINTMGGVLELHVYDDWPATKDLALFDKVIEAKESSFLAIGLLVVLGES